MRHLPSAGALSVVTLAAAALVGCGTPDRTVVSAPSSVPAVAAAASIDLAPRESTSSPIVVTSLVTGTSCPNLQFTIATYLFRVSESTQYSGGTCADIHAGSRINFNGTRETPTSQIFNVSALSFAPSSSPSPSIVPVQTEIVVTSTGAGMCPELQFFSNSYAFNVSYATQYSGGTCSDIRAGAHVALVGTKKDSESFVRVTSLTFGRDGTPAPGGRAVDGEGEISSIRNGAACPALAFYIGPYLVDLTTSTTFDRGVCSDLAVGVRVHVWGTMTDNAVTATRISVQAAPPRATVEGEGRVSTVVSGTTCPSLVFTIDEYTIALNASTAFVGGTCADVSAGRRVGVQAIVTGDKHVLATTITFKADDGR